jgi:hypothetical protein
LTLLQKNRDVDRTQPIANKEKVVNTRILCTTSLLVLSAAFCALAADEAAEIAKKLSNLVASMISLPFQSNFDFGGGPNDDGFQYKLNIQPVIPFALNDKWNLIT